MRNRENARPESWQARGRAPQTDGITAPSGQSIPLPRPVYNGAGKPVGTIARDTDGTVLLVKAGLDPAAHRLRQPEGWATDSAHLDLLRAAGGVGVRLHLVDGRTLTATLVLFDLRGISFDRGHGPQRVLPSKLWTVHVAGVRQLSFLWGPP